MDSFSAYLPPSRLHCSASALEMTNESTYLFRQSLRCCNGRWCRPGPGADLSHREEEADPGKSVVSDLCLPVAEQPDAAGRGVAAAGSLLAHTNCV